jgi:hypothetical protein
VGYNLVTVNVVRPKRLQLLLEMWKCYYMEINFEVENFKNYTPSGLYVCTRAVRKVKDVCAYNPRSCMFVFTSDLPSSDVNNALFSRDFSYSVCCMAVTGCGCYRVSFI